MEKEFDFKNIGKQMPYRTPDGFFDRMQEQVSARTKVENIKTTSDEVGDCGNTGGGSDGVGIGFLPAGTPEAEQVSSILYLWQPVLTTHIRMQWIIL